MADSKDNNETSSENFADDLDAMLNEAESSIDDQDQIIDDEDAIDRLLMDDAFDIAEGETADKDVDNILEQSPSKEPSEIKNDEFDGNEQIDSIIEGVMSADNDEEEESVDEFDVDNLLDSVSESNVEQDEFAEIDEFSEDIIEPEPEPEPESGDDFLMADFDISAGDENADNVDNIFDEFSEIESSSSMDSSDQPSNQEEESVDKDDADVEQEKAKISAAASSQTNAELEKNNAAIEGITAQVNQLWSENEALKQQILALDVPVDNSSTAEEIETLNNEQRKLRQSIKENASKVPVLTYVAIGAAVLALLLGGGLGAIGYGAQSDVTELTELVTTLEEEIDILTAKDIITEIKKTNEKIALLTTEDNAINKQLDEVNKSLQSGQLKSVVDDLVKQNDHAQEAIELLLAKVETLEKRKFVTKASKRAKKAVAKVNWVVNLVSFKQEWYAKRKAKEFEKKGVPAEVIQVKVNGENWFRLRVIGFKSKYEAAAYAVKVKKTLNLSSVWVTKA